MSGAPKQIPAEGDEKANGRYPAVRTSPWFFIVLAGVTVAFILAGVFKFEPLTRLLHWLAVVL